MASVPHLDIGTRRVAPDERPYVIAEVAQTHDGSLGNAHAFVDAVADTGADAIKFQTHLPDAESTLDEPFRVLFSKQDETRYGYWTRMAFTEEQWSDLADHAQERGLHFLSSAFSIEAVELLDRLRVPAWKVGSGEFRSTALLERMASTKRPVLLSTGMSTMAEIGSVVELLRERDAPFALLQCTSKYPTSLEDVGLNVLAELRDRFGSVVGLSDHSATIWPSLFAAARGASIIEVHVAFDRRQFGPDVPASLEIAELALLVEGLAALAQMDASPVDKDTVAASMGTMRDLFTKSLAPRHELPAGTVLSRSDLTEKKPGTGIPAERLGEVVGRRTTRPVVPARLLQWDDLEPGPGASA